MNEHTITSGINDTTSISTSNDNITCTTQEVPAVPLLDHSAGTANNNNNNNNTNNTNNNNETDEDHISSPTPGSDEVNLNANHVNVNNGVNDPSSSSASSLEHPPLAIIENNINHDVHGVVHGHHVGLDASVAVAPTDAGTGSNEDHIARSVQDTATVNIANSAAVAARDDVVLVHPHHHHHPSSTVAPHDHIHGDGTNHKVDDGGIPLPPLSIAVHPEQYQAQQQQQQHEHQQQVLSVATGTSEQISNTNHNITETTTTHHHHRHHQDHQQVVPVLTQQTQHHQQHQQPMVPQDPSFGFSYFAIRRGKFGLRSSIFLNWKDVERFIGGYDCAEYASFDKFDEAVTYLLSGESGADGGGTDVPVHSDAESVTENGSSGPAKKRKLGSENETRIMSTAISNDKNFSLISPFIRSPISASNPTTAASVAFTSASLSSATNHLLTGHRRRGRVKAEANPNRKPTKAWEKMYERYAKYVKEKGTLDVDPSKENADLLRWTRQQQHEYRYLKEGKASSMFQVKIDKLRDVGFEFKFVSMEDRVSALLQFKEKFGHYNIPETHPILGRWVDELKKTAKKVTEEGDCTALFEGKIKELASLGFKIDMEDGTEGTSDEGDRATFGYDYNFNYADHSISPPPPGHFVTGRADDDKKWRKNFNDLVEYKKKNGSCEVPPSQHTPLSYWVTQQHKEYQKVQEGLTSRLTLQKVQQLTDLGFVFRQVAKSFSWEQRIDQLKKYRQKHGHTRVPKSDPQLGVFVNRQRYEYSKYKSNRPSTMTEERLRDLQALDFVFVAGKKMDHVDFRNKKSWEQRFEELLQFRDSYGHVVVPQSYPGLGEWVHSQRLYYKKLKAGKKSPLTNERLLKLADVGFVFDATKRRGNHINDAGSARCLSSISQTSNIIAASIPQQDHVITGFNPEGPDGPNNASV